MQIPRTPGPIFELTPTRYDPERRRGPAFESSESVNSEADQDRRTVAAGRSRGDRFQTGGRTEVGGWESARDLLASISLSPPWTLNDFIGWFEGICGRQVDLAPWRGCALSPPRCAALLVLDDRLVVRFDNRRSTRHQTQQIMHEFGHVLGDHGEGHFGIGKGMLTEGLDTAKIAGVVQRQNLDCESEIQAELIGTYLAIMTREVAELSWGTGHFLDKPTADDSPCRRMQTLSPLWTALVEAVPDVQLRTPEGCRSNAFIEHRMRIEIEDAIVALSPAIKTPRDAGSSQYAESIALALARRLDSAHADNRGPGSGGHGLAINDKDTFEIAAAWSARVRSRGTSPLSRRDAGERRGETSHPEPTMGVSE